MVPSVQTTLDWAFNCAIPRSFLPFPGFPTPSIDTTTGTVTRAVYVLDIASGTSKTGVALYVYTKTDVITSTFENTTITLDKAVGLPLLGGTSALASMAANRGYLFIGTNQSPQAIRLAKNKLSYVQIGIFAAG